MHPKNFAPILLALGLSVTAHAANISFKLPTVIGNIAPLTMPGVSIIPVSLPTVNAVIAAPSLAPTLTVSAIPAPAPVSLPVLPAAVIGQARLPAPLVIEHFTIEKLLDDKLADAAAEAFAAQHPAALNELRDAAAGRDPIRVTPGNLFDGRRRQTHRELELPSNKYF